MQGRPDKCRVASRYLKQSRWDGPPEEAIKLFEPYVKYASDADSVADRVGDSFKKSLLTALLPLPAKMQGLTWANQESQSYDFNSRSGAWDKGQFMEMGGTVSYPSLCTIKGNWKINIAKRWLEALQTQKSQFDNPGWDAIPMPENWIKDILIETSAKAVQKMDTGQEFQEGLEQSMYACREFEDRSETTSYDHNGDEEDLAEGSSPSFDFRFTTDIDEVLVTVPRISAVEAVVRVEIPVNIRLRAVLSPW